MTEIKPPEKGWTDQTPPWNIALAIQCLGEIRNLSTVADSAQRLLQVICALLQTELQRGFRLHRFLADPIATSVEMIGPNWPQRLALVEWLKQLPPNSSMWLYARPFGQIVGSFGREMDEIHQFVLSYASDDNEAYRVLAPYTLAIGWRDDAATLPLLKSLAVEDTAEDVRSTALDALAEYYHDQPATLSLLRARAVEDTYELARYSALYSLAEYYHEDVATLPLLRARAVEDASDIVRRTTLEKIAQHYHEDAATLPLLRERAVEDADEYVRFMALDALAKYYREDASTLPFLRARAVDDQLESVRDQAQRLIAWITQQQNSESGTGKPK